MQSKVKRSLWLNGAQKSYDLSSRQYKEQSRTSDDSNREISINTICATENNARRTNLSPNKETYGSV
jgi:hypothetical protein